MGQDFRPVPRADYALLQWAENALLIPLEILF
jgi:hypothetical protein